jgi:pSer/pThr/pTyr-binding forkhead associated (FHA) protein
MEQNITNPNPSSPSITPIRLDILDKKGEVLVTGEYVKEKIVLGRILSADLRVDDLSVSRIHALIEVRGTVVSITDLASSHGTFINGKKVVESKLSFGDTIRLGTTQIRISKGSGVASVAQGAFEGQPFSEGDATQTQIDRALLESLDRRAPSER